jgi:DNA-binding NarL/FixJ family response regulator
MRILLVDDHAILRKAIRGLLSSHAELNVVGEAENGEEAVSSTANLKPDLIIMDVNIPGRDGISAASEIKRSWPEVKILIFSNHHLPILIKMAKEIGLDGFVAKSEGGVGLMKAIEAIELNQTYFPLHPPV